MHSPPAPSPSQPSRPPHRLPRRLALPLVALAVFLAIVGIARAAEGQLSFKEPVPEFSLPWATGVVASPDGKFLYATHSSSLTVLARDAGSGDLTWVETEHDDADDPSDAGAMVDGLRGATSVAISPDGATVYVTGGSIDNALAVFERDPVSGRLSFLEFEEHQVDDPSDPGGEVVAMFRPEMVAASPDGESVYVLTGNGGNSVVVFDRDPASGRLSYVESERETVDDPDDPGGKVAGIQWGTALTVAADGGSVYATSHSQHTVAAFDRDPASGELSFVEIEKDGVEDPGDLTGIVDGLDRPKAVVGSPDGAFVYVSGGSDSAIAVFKRDAHTSELTFVEVEKDGVDDSGDPGGEVTGLSSPTEIAVSPDGANLYVATGAGVVSFRFLPAGGEIAFVGFEPVESRWLGQLLLSPDGAHLYASGGEHPGLALLSPAAAAAPSFGMPRFERLIPALSVGEVQDAAISADGRHLITTAEETLRVFSRDPGSGSVLAQVDEERSEVDDPSDPGGGVEDLYEPRGIAFAPDGERVYVGDYDAVHVFDYDPATGELSWLESEFDEVNDPADPGGEVRGLRGVQDLVVSPDGRGVFGVSEYEKTLFAFDRDPASGRISFVEAEFEGTNGAEGLGRPSALTISPDGRGIAVANTEYDGEVGVFARDPASNEVELLEVERLAVDDPGDPGGAVEGIRYPEDILFGGAGSLYLAGEEGVARFQRDPASGLLAFAEWETSGVDDPADPGATVSGVAYSTRLALSRGGTHLYVAAERAEATAPRLGALAVFGVAPGSGALSFLEAELGAVDDPGDPGPAPRGFANPTALIVSPDDRFVYVGSNQERGFAVFARETAPPAPPAALPAPPAPPAASPNPVRPRADTRLVGAWVKAARKQRQRGRAVVVTLTVRAGERASARAWGKVRVGKRSYKLKPAKRPLRPGKVAKLKLRPAKAAQRKKIAAALRRGAKVRAVVTASIADRAGNGLRRKQNVRLLAPRQRGTAAPHARVGS